ncbi:MAG: site-specific DNA-methyltransferase [Candidatus Thermoplasmatota archaeon]|nr:site-specific DNA-methyltransferase [Candidatus Thermoplasmatota archaeon]
MRPSSNGDAAEHQESIEAQDLSAEFRKYIGRQVSYATHGIHRYPAKFIPQIPRFCLKSLSEAGDVVLDPFMGSGTTLLESYIMGRSCYGIDIHPLARLIAKVKTTPLEPGPLEREAEELIRKIREDDEVNDAWIPEIPNRDHWFRPKVLQELGTIKKHIWEMRPGPQQDFFKICFSSVIRRLSNSDSDSLIPEVTSFRRKLDQQGKTSFDVFAKFDNSVRSRLVDVRDLWKISRDVMDRYRERPRVDIIGRDARDIDLEDSSVDLAVTSPPYASAVHYVSVHKLEMFWLDMIKGTADLDAEIIGSARAYSSEYRDWHPKSRIRSLNEVLGQLTEKDRKSAYVVWKYFDQMRMNFNEVNRVLARGSSYCMIVGENTFRRVRIPTYRILAQVAADSGFELKTTYMYDVINRHLDIPRWNDSRIERDYILVLRRRKSAQNEAL